MAGINIGIVVADASTYRHFADHGLWSFVRSGWLDIVMAHPGAWIGLLAAGEVAIGLAFLGPKPWPRTAYAAAIGFHVALMSFGWGVWLWAVPAIGGLVIAARHDLGADAGRARSPARTAT
ncbi:conserved hypothetical protein [Aeromicrobium sp. 9AM]|nr:conserved hypothetical protein [Aeromicrobium sp. 9AM]